MKETGTIDAMTCINDVTTQLVHRDYLFHSRYEVYQILGLLDVMEEGGEIKHQRGTYTHLGADAVLQENDGRPYYVRYGEQGMSVTIKQNAELLHVVLEPIYLSNDLEDGYDLGALMCSAGKTEALWQVGVGITFSLEHLKRYSCDLGALLPAQLCGDDAPVFVTSRRNNGETVVNIGCVEWTDDTTEQFTGHFSGVDSYLTSLSIQEEAGQISTEGNRVYWQTPPSSIKSIMGNDPLYQPTFTLTIGYGHLGQSRLPETVEEVEAMTGAARLIVQRIMDIKNGTLDVI